MKELVSDERLYAIIDDINARRESWVGTDLAFAVARAALKDSGVMNDHVVDLPDRCPFKDERWCEILESMYGFECRCEPACPLRKGAVLVRAKAMKPSDYEVRVDFAADGPSETAWSVMVRDSSGKVVAVATGLESSDEAIAAAKAWIGKGGAA